MSEEQFWRCTFRKLISLLDVKAYFDNPDNAPDKDKEVKKKEKTETVYIDQVGGF